MRRKADGSSAPRATSPAAAGSTAPVRRARHAPPRGLILMTGEDLPTGQSILARLAAVEVEADDVDDAALTVAQQLAATAPTRLRCSPMAPRDRPGGGACAADKARALALLPEFRSAHARTPWTSPNPLRRWRRTSTLPAPPPASSSAWPLWSQPPRAAAIPARRGGDDRYFLHHWPLPSPPARPTWPTPPTSWRRPRTRSAAVALARDQPGPRRHRQGRGTSRASA